VLCVVSTLSGCVAATFPKITVTNLGDVILTTVTVVDQKSPRCNRKIGTLAPGVNYTCTGPNVTAGFTNLIVAAGTPPSRTHVNSGDTAPVTFAPLKPPKQPMKKTRVKLKVVGHMNSKATG
jgi:hypothetical protein